MENALFFIYLFVYIYYIFVEQSHQIFRDYKICIYRLKYKMQIYKILNNDKRMKRTKKFLKIERKTFRKNSA